jgi:hypothetical protein
MLTTYLDESLRITRDERGYVSVLLKDDPLFPESDEQQGLLDGAEPAAA